MSFFFPRQKKYVICSFSLKEKSENVFFSSSKEIRDFSQCYIYMDQDSVLLYLFICQFRWPLLMTNRVTHMLTLYGYQLYI